MVFYECHYVDGVCEYCGKSQAKYEYNGTDEYTLIKYILTTETLMIPETYNDGVNGEHPVVGIGENAFKDNKKISKIILP